MKQYALWLALSVATTAQAHIYSYGIIGDAGMLNHHVVEARQSLQHSKVFDLILPGDNLYDMKLSYPDVWDSWLKLGFQFEVVALGNHLQGYDKEMQYFGMPGEYYATGQTDLRFLVLNSDNVATAKEQAAWLKYQLANAPEKFIFVVYHHPPYTLSEHHGWKEKQAFHEAIRPLLRKYQKRITGVIVGHDHMASLVDMGGIPLIVSGAAGESFDNPGVDYETDGIRIDTKWVSKGRYHWTRLDMDTSDGSVWVNFVGTESDSVSCSVRIAPGPWLYRSNCAQH
ncbi:MAG: metallophosphoesterase [Bdellovibrionales bacterium]|nr:metallophosphoesterase [Bdellovibrionales bacterium]